MVMRSSLLTFAHVSKRKTTSITFLQEKTARDCRRMAQGQNMKGHTFLFLYKYSWGNDESNLSSSPHAHHTGTTLYNCLLTNPDESENLLNILMGKKITQTFFLTTSQESLGQLLLWWVTFTVISTCCSTPPTAPRA